jgi:DNA polymerase eta
VKELAKSMLAAKSFETANQMPALERWMGILAEELADRLAEDCATHNRRPRLLTLYYR